jgi:hypothetical protein
MKKLLIAGIIGFSTVGLVGCQANSKEQILQVKESSVQLRSYQSRAFDTADRESVLRSAMATLQDLSFVIDKADYVLGSVTGTKFHKDGMQHVALKMTVTVRKRSEKQVLVRANAQYGLLAVEEPEPYQDFFTNLSKSMFLEAHQID